MSSQALEQMLENTFAPNIAQGRMYQTIDTYANGTTTLYSSGKPLNPPKPTDNMQGPGNVMSNQYNLDQGWQLQERFDFSGHDGSGPHVNYEFMNPSGSVQKDLNSYLGKNDHHSMDLFKK